MTSAKRSSLFSLALVGFFAILGVLSSAFPGWCLYDDGILCPPSRIMACVGGGTWTEYSITVSTNTTVTFFGSDPSIFFHIIPMIDSDTENSVAKKQGLNSFQLQWDLNYIAGNGFQQTDTCWPEGTVSKTYTTAGTYYVYLRVDDVGTISDDSPCYADNVFVVYVQ